MEPMEQAFQDSLHLQDNPSKTPSAPPQSSETPSTTLIPKTLHPDNDKHEILPSISPATYRWLESAVACADMNNLSCISPSIAFISPLTNVDWTDEQMPLPPKRKAINSPECPVYPLDASGKARKPLKKMQMELKCKCSGKCRNQRCVCVKAGQVCGESCKCMGCRNPFAVLSTFGLDGQEWQNDACLMQNLSKIKDMGERLMSMLKLECCGKEVAVHEVVRAEGFVCGDCKTPFSYSWCLNRVFNSSRKPRRHCDICKRCSDHRYQHCPCCHRCYFAGAGNTFSCNCPGSTALREKEKENVKQPSAKPPVHKAEPQNTAVNNCPVQ